MTSFVLYSARKAGTRKPTATFWVVNVPEAVDQVDFDLSHTPGIKNKHGSIFYHGPMVELQFLF